MSNIGRSIVHLKISNILAILTIFVTAELYAISFDVRSEVNKVVNDGYSSSLKQTTKNKHMRLQASTLRDAPKRWHEK